MDWQSAGARAEVDILQKGNPARPDRFQSWGHGVPRIMSSFAGDPRGSSGAQPERDGPVLVMPPPPPQPKRSGLWLKRLSLVVFVLVCLEVGIVLTVLPWTRLWAENSLLLGHPQLHEFLQQNFVRGMVSGLGLVDVWMGVAEAVRYREGPDS